MKLYKIILILASYNYGLAQNANVILQVNDQLLNGSVADIFFTFPYEDSVKNPVGYYPGELIIGVEIWDKINYLENEKFTLHFDYYTYDGGKQDIAHFAIELNKYILNQPYLIINIYDFRNKKY